MEYFAPLTRTFPSGRKKKRSGMGDHSMVFRSYRVGSPGCGEQYPPENPGSRSAFATRDFSRNMDSIPFSWDSILSIIGFSWSDGMLIRAPIYIGIYLIFFN
jgi:hypothetical protein